MSSCRAKGLREDKPRNDWIWWFFFCDVSPAIQAILLWSFKTNASQHSAWAEAPNTALNVSVKSNPYVGKTLTTVRSQYFSTNDAPPLFFCSIHGVSLQLKFFWRLRFYSPALLYFACFATYCDLAGYFLFQLILKVFHFEKCFCWLKLLFAFSHQEWLHVLQDILAVFNQIFSRRHPRQNVKILRYFRDRPFHDIQTSLSPTDVVLSGQTSDQLTNSLHGVRIFLGS